VCLTEDGYVALSYEAALVACSLHRGGDVVRCGGGGDDADGVGAEGGHHSMHTRSQGRTPHHGIIWNVDYFSPLLIRTRDAHLGARRRVESLRVTR
jgi:hypothetical protein